jgi:hypothetical protein
MTSEQVSALVHLSGYKVKSMYVTATSDSSTYTSKSIQVKLFGSKKATFNNLDKVPEIPSNFTGTDQHIPWVL